MLESVLIFFKKNSQEKAEQNLNRRLMLGITAVIRLPQ